MVRAVSNDALRGLRRSPVLVLQGARGAGKSALAREIVGPKAVWHSLDDAGVRALADDDPDVLLDANGPIVLSEIQRAPHLLGAIIAGINKKQGPGQFVLTSSVEFARLEVQKKLRKRSSVVTVHTASRSELLGSGGDWLSLILRRRWPSPKPLSRDDLAHLLASRSDTGSSGLRQRLRGAWIDTYLERLLNIDAPSIGATQPELLHALLKSIATNPAEELNSSQLSRQTGASRGTVDKHLAILESLYLLQRLPGWGDGITTRPVSRPKLHLADTRLSTVISGHSPTELSAPSGHLMLGRLMEQLAVNELTKQAAVSPMRQQLRHFRDRNGLEVPIVIDTAEGIVAVDVHPARQVSVDQVRHLAQFRDRAAGMFRVGIVLYMGKAATLGDRLHALPINSLWEHSPAR